MAEQTTNGILEEFRLEFLQLWRHLPNKLPFVILFVAWMALFQFSGTSTIGYAHSHSLFDYMYNAFSEGRADLLESEGSYAFLVPPLVLCLYWFKRRQLLAMDLQLWWPGLLVVVGGAALHMLGYALQQPRISVLGMLTGLYGVCGMVWGYGWLRETFFPFALLVFCIPIGTLAEPVTYRLRLLVSELVGLISNYVLAIDVNVQGNILTDPTGHYQYEIAAACSGIRSLIATLLLAIVLGCVSFTQTWKRLLLIASAFPLAVLGNLLRMMTIVIAAELGGQQWGSYVHDGGPGGILSLLPYVPAFVGLLALERYLGRPFPARGAGRVHQILKFTET